MTPTEKQLIHQLEDQIKALSFLIAGSQVSESQAWIELNNLLTELKIEASK